MKSKKIIIIAVVVILISIGIILFVVLRKGATTERVKNKMPKKILFVGDSQSAIKTADGKDISYTYPRLLKNTLEPRGYEIDVLAIVGKTTKWMKDNLPTQLAKKKYDRIYILGGGNDTSNMSISQNTTLNNFQDMVNMGKSSGADVFVMLGYRIDNFSDYRKMPLTIYLKKQEDWIPYIERRKEIQTALPKTIVNATGFVPAYDLNAMTNDGIHPTTAGHKIIANIMLKHITQ
jgi:lysophospholipase L1-like esterase